MRSGVSAMETATAAISGAVTSFGMTAFCEAKENRTNANSPPWASDEGEQEVLVEPHAEGPPEPEQHDELDEPSRPPTRPRMSCGWARIRSKSIDAPTAMKNTASSRPLNGSMSLSSSCRYSLLARTTPARKVPSAGLSPTCVIRSAMAMTSRSAAAVNSSRRRVPAMTRKTGRSR